MDRVPPPRRSGAEVDPLHPHHIVIHEGYTFLHARMDGSVGRDPEEGLFDYDTRVLSWHDLRIAGQQPVGVAAPSLDSASWRSVRTVRLEGGTPEGPALTQDVLELATEHRVGLGMTEKLRVRNHSMAEHVADLEIEVGADFRDISEIFGERRQDGTIEHEWDQATQVLTLRYCAEHEGRTFERGLRIHVRNAWTTPVVARVGADVPPGEMRYRVVLPLVLDPHGTRELQLVYASLVDGRWRTPLEVDTGRPARELQRRERVRREIRDDRVAFQATDPFVPAVASQAMDDLLALRNWDLEEDGTGWIVNAGVPTFTGFFGRDSLATGMQSALAGADLLRGAIERAARTQGQERDDFREEEPGRIVHEMRRGPLADLGIRPHARYYGSHTGPAAFVVALGEYWRWTGDLDFVRRQRDAAEAAIEWAKRRGDRNGDGFLEYERRSPEGLANQGWKDSSDAMRYPDGSVLKGPIAPVEEQALYYQALERMAELFDALGEKRLATNRRSDADRMRDLVEKRFWMDDEGFYALAIDAAGNQVRTIASNALHVLAAGLAAPDRAQRVAERLMSPELFSGWGIRTLSAKHPSYNPFAYHLGTVWPVESATFAAGAKRYGLDQHVGRLADATFAAAGHCHRVRLPEVLAGLPREETDFPITYPNAKSPQAWTASATIAVLGTMLGLEPDAQNRCLRLLRPTLPSWLPDLSVRGLTVGDSTVDLAFRRLDDGSTEHEVVHVDGRVDVVRVDASGRDAEANGR